MMTNSLSVGLKTLLTIIMAFFVVFVNPVKADVSNQVFSTPIVNQKTEGMAIPVLCNPDISQCPASAQLLGTVNNNRGHWNPFLPENNMIEDGPLYYKELELKANGGRHGNGIYAFRFVTNQNLQQTFKADHNRTDSTGKPKLVAGELAHQAQNIIIKVDRDDVYKISFNPSNLTFDVTPHPTYLTKIESVQLNGFVWDDEDMFQKFDETRANHEITKNGDWWEKTIPLKANGGIDFRADGVYQFLFSANHNEDWGFGAYNNGKNTLTGGTGFGSSGGQSNHSAITIQVFEDGNYTIQMNPLEYKFQVKAPQGVRPVKIWNEVNSLQLLGTFYSDVQFDPTKAEHNMEPVGDKIWTKTLQLQPGIYGANFAISGELFLDTMSLGAWLESDHPNKLIGRGWHGKPNEPNIFFEVKETGAYQFTYDGTQDRFSIESLGNVSLQPLAVIKTLQLVGNFAEPLQAWEPTSTANNMQQISPHIFSKDVQLEANRKYEYKYNANNWGWLWVFADYELDGYGRDFLGRNPDPAHSRIEDLKMYGQLTTHGNPPPLQFIPTASGWYTFTVNLETGAYSVQPSKK
ncbi:MAG: hypothetical protein O9972_00135 [Burkholderiales bacterium]|nr:hypothetical protein [Burkholderiales bacterium]